MTTSGVCNSFVCANQHCCNDDGATRPILLVTASVDRMVVKKPIRVDIDLELTGAVTWVGRSSMEIQLEVTQSTQGTPYESRVFVFLAFWAMIGPWSLVLNNLGSLFGILLSNIIVQVTMFFKMEMGLCIFSISERSFYDGNQENNHKPLIEYGHG